MSESIRIELLTNDMVSPWSKKCKEALVFREWDSATGVHSKEFGNEQEGLHIEVNEFLMRKHKEMLGHLQAE